MPYGEEMELDRGDNTELIELVKSLHKQLAEAKDFKELAEKTADVWMKTSEGHKKFWKEAEANANDFENLADTHFKSIMKFKNALLKCKNYNDLGTMCEHVDDFLEDFKLKPTGGMKTDAFGNPHEHPLHLNESKTHYICNECGFKIMAKRFRKPTGG